MTEKYDFLFKFLVIGSAGSGKSCLLHQFIENKYGEDMFVFAGTLEAEEEEERGRRKRRKWFHEINPKTTIISSKIY